MNHIHMKTKVFKKILIANRGEIALRIIRTARTMQIKTVAVYSEGEEKSLHVSIADEAVLLGSGSLSDTYLNIEKIIAIAKQTGADAIHPGYGFLSEQADFAAACEQQSLVFIGPSPAVLDQMGNKLTAKAIALKAGVPVLENVRILNVNELPLPESLTYPLLIKAAYGGGGKGMQIVSKPEELRDAVMAASRAARNYFGNGEVFLESYLEEARHVEVQILGDRHGNLVHLFERDCTVQRNHQKIVEEAPALALDARLREKLHQAALSVGRAVAYENAGTVEFLVDPQGQFYFLEMNPRIQVEHPVTEQITGIDLVREQINIAAGNILSFQQNDIQAREHSIEVRVYQEDPLNNFSPSTKPPEQFILPEGNNIRIESDLQVNQSATQQFDPLLLKLIVTASNRTEAVQMLQKALKETYIAGTASNLDYLKAIVQHAAFIENKLSTRFLSITHQELTDSIRQMVSNVYYPFVAAAMMLQFNHKDEKTSVWRMIGPRGLSAGMTMELEGEKLPFHWEKRGVDFVLSLGSNIHSVQCISHTETQLCLRIDGQSHVVQKISLKPGQTRWGVEGFIFEPFFDGFLEEFPDETIHQHTVEDTDSNCIVSHLHGKIETINIKINQTVKKGDLLLTINAMKSENAVKAPRKAKIKEIKVAIGDQVSDGMTLVLLEEIAL